MAAALLHVLQQAGDEALSAAGVGVAAVHEAVDVCAVLYAVVLRYVEQLEEMVERAVHAAVAHEPHEVYVLPVLFRVFVCAHDFGVLHYRAVAARAVNFHKVLIDDAAAAYVEMAHFRVAHLPVG